MLKEMKAAELKAMAKELTVKNWWLLKKEDLIKEIERIQAEQEAARKAKEAEEKKATESKPAEGKKSSKKSDSSVTDLGAQIINFLQIELGQYERGYSCTIIRDIAKGLGKSTSMIKGAVTKLREDGYIQIEESEITDMGSGEIFKNNFIHLTESGWDLKLEVTNDEPLELGISLIDICEKLNIKPKKARRILRDNKIEKPGKTWVWPETPQEIIDLLVGGAK